MSLFGGFWCLIGVVTGGVFGVGDLFLEGINLGFKGVVKFV